MPDYVSPTATPLEVVAGTLVCFHGKLPHFGGPNRSGRSRHAYTLHVTDCACRWSGLNWLRRCPKVPLRRLV